MTTYVCIASGPSLTQADVDYVRGKARVIVVNDNYIKAPWADYLWASDFDWWLAEPQYIMLEGTVGVTHAGFSKRVFAGARCTLDLIAAGEFGLHYLVTRNEPDGGRGLNKRGEINHGSHSGYAAIGLAYWLGAKRIILLGYDCGIAEDGKTHWFGSHPKVKRIHPLNGREYESDLERTSLVDFSEWRKEMEPLARDLRDAGVEVINCSRRTTLECFERKALEEVL